MSSTSSTSSKSSKSSTSSKFVRALGGWPLLVVWLTSGLAAAPPREKNTAGAAASSDAESASSWVTHQHDARRSGYSSAHLPAPRLTAAWTWQSAAPPQPAWAGPAKWDAYSGRRDLPPMRSYDTAFHPILAEGRVYFGSSVDDTLYCLDADSGKPLWTFTADAPIRTAPSFWRDRVYFGADDGHAYCLSAASGALHWRHSPVASKRWIFNNGRLISPHPCRTGVLVADGVAYFGCALLPWSDAYLCGLDAESGASEGPGLFTARVHGATLEGPPAATADLLVFPQGRIAPRLFGRSDGGDKGPLKNSSGGSIVVIDVDSNVFHGPGADSRRGAIVQTNSGTREAIASQGRGNALVVREQMSFLLTDDLLIASDLAKRKQVWSAPCSHPCCLIGVGDYLIAGGIDEVAAYRRSDGQQVWRRPVQGRAHGLAATRTQLAVATDSGAIHLFRVSDEAPPADTAAAPSGAALLESAPLDDPRLHSQWAFQRRQWAAAPESEATDGPQVRPLVGKVAGRVLGLARLKPAGRSEALWLDGVEAGVRLADDHSQVGLPREALTVEAWVRIDEPLAWGGILGAIQDNGAFEKGWLLGYRDARFCFAVASENGPGRLTYLTAPQDFPLQRWRHVAGVYDGKSMKLIVDGKLAAESAEQRGAIAYPPQAFFEIGAYHDKDEHFRMRGMVHEVRLYSAALSVEELQRHYEAKAPALPSGGSALAPAPASSPVKGLYVQFDGPTAATVRWKTDTPLPTRLEYWPHDALPDDSLPDRPSETQRQTVASATPVTEHRARMTGLRHNRVYHFAVSAGNAASATGGSATGASATAGSVTAAGGESLSRDYECDAFFHFSPAEPSGADPALSRLSNAEKAADHEVEQALRHAGLRRDGRQRGVCLVLGADPSLALQLARRTQMRVICWDTDRERVQLLREALAARGWLGRVVARRVESLAELPMVGGAANLVLAAEPLTEAFFAAHGADEIRRVLCPGGVAWLAGGDRLAGRDLLAEDRAAWEAKWRGDGPQVDVSFPVGEDGAATGRSLIRRAAAPGAGDWTHLYGPPSNTAFGGEQLAGAKSADDFEVQWIGRPGPRFKPDRSGRKPSPLAAGGRLFVQGAERLAALDAYNGEVLWSLEIPGLARFNMPRDCGNWCVDQQRVFAVVADHCWEIDAATGAVVRQHPVRAPAPDNGGVDAADGAFEWGAVISLDRRLIGTAVRQGSAWRDYWGGEGWYDARSGPATDKVCSDSLFSLDKSSGQTQWRYSGGVILQSTLAVENNRVYFVECRHPAVLEAPERRIGRPELWLDQHLVALDADTGSVVWERPLDTVDGKVAFYLAAAPDRLVLVSSNDARFHVYTYSTQQGQSLWDRSFGWIGGKGDHGKALSRPAIVGDRLFVRPRVMRLSDGQLTEQQMPGGGCGTYACSAQALFFRSGNVTVWNNATGRSSQWPRLRPDCWLSVIPANGMLLNVEGGGGCSCGSWLETTIGFRPLGSDAK